MKKFTLLLAALLVSVSTLFAADEVYKTISFAADNTTRGESTKTYTSTWNSATDGFQVSIKNFYNNQWNNNWTFIKAGSKNSTTTGTITTSAVIDKAVTKVVVTIDAIANGSVTATTLEAATDANFTKDLVTVSPANYSKAGNWEYVLTSTAKDKYYRLSFTCKNNTTKNGVITLSKIEYYIAAQDVDATAIELDKTELSLEQYKYTTLAATLTPTDATTEVVWSSKDEKVATVENGKVTAVGVGTTIITATAGTVKAECAVTVTAATPITVAKAVEIAQTVTKDNEIAVGGMYVIRGYVTAIAYAYSEDYNNLSVWIDDEKGGSTSKFEAYQVTPVVEDDQTTAVGDLVEVIGDITKYTNSKTSTTIYETVGKTGTISIVTKAQYTITANVNNEEMGKVSGAGTFDRGTEATLTATANTGYEFVNWTDLDDKVVSTNAAYTFTVTEEVALIANFKEIKAATWYGQEPLTGTLSNVDYSIVYEITRNITKTLTFKLAMNDEAAAVENLKITVVINNAEVGYITENFTSGEFTTSSYYTDGDELNIQFYLGCNGGGKFTNTIKYTVGSSNDKPTAIDAVSTQSKATKRIENGVLIIEKNGIRYTAQGVVVE